MAGIAGAVIGLASGAQAAIAGAQAVIDGTDSCRGCTTNFIGFGLGSSSTEQLPADFNVTDDSVVLATTTPADHEPLYTGAVLTWPASTP